MVRTPPIYLVDEEMNGTIAPAAGGGGSKNYSIYLCNRLGLAPLQVQVPSIADPPSAVFEKMNPNPLGAREGGMAS